MHEDLYDLSSSNETIIVGVCILEDLVISLPVSQRYHPVDHWLELTKNNIYEMLDEGENIC